MPSTKRVTLTLDSDLVSSLNSVSEHLGVSRSSLVGQLIEATVPEMLSILDSIPKSPQRSDVIRARGKSMDMVRGRVEKLQSAMDSLDSSLGGTK